MLRRLVVKNYAIIDHIDIAFSPNLNIITGETGAGKSLLLGALSLILGQRADTKVLFDDGSKCVSEGVFDIDGYGLEEFFIANDLDYEQETIIRREINPSGKSRAFINDTPVTLNIVKELGAQLVNLHSQHETLSLNSASFQVQLLDALAGSEQELTAYRKALADYKAIQQELDALTERNSEVTDMDYLRFQFNELNEAGLEGEEQDSLEQERDSLDHAEEIKSTLSKAVYLLNDGEAAITTQLREAGALLRGVEDYHKDIAALQERLDSVLLEVSDISRELEHIGESTEHNPERIQELNDRLNLIYKLQSKHQVSTVEELLAIKEELEQKLDSLSGYQGKLEALQQQLADQQQAVEKAGKALFNKRQKAIPELEKQTAGLLNYVGMPHARVTVQHELLPFEKATALGLDKVTYLFTANKGSQPQELRKVASGGELSRLMLVLKSLTAEKLALPTLIFDEIDSGISGEVANKVGAVLQKLGKGHQLICITHLPQIAGKGSKHLFVHKELKDEKTVTRIKPLNEEERVVEIAKMLGGESLTDAALANARELLLN